MNTRTRWSLLGVLCMSLVIAPACTQGHRWETYNDTGRAAYEQGNYPEAEKQWLAALQEAESFGPEDQRFATSLSRLGSLYRAQGQYAEAEPLYQRAMVIWENALGPEHPFVARSLDNLANLYSDQGKYAEAEPLFRRSLAIAEKALGPEHPNVAQVLENYATLLRKMGRDDEAEELEGRAQTIRATIAQ